MGVWVEGVQLRQKEQHAWRLRFTRQHGNWKYISMVGAEAQRTFQESQGRRPEGDVACEELWQLYPGEWV